MRKKRWLSVIVSLIVLLLIIDIGLSNYFYGMVIKRGPKDFLQGNQDLEVSNEAMEVFLAGDWRDWMKSQTFERHELISFDGIHLKGFYLPAKQPTTKMVIFAHGYLGNAFDMGLFGEYYYENVGYNLFIPDLRGHGNSEGEYIGFGWHDRIDLLDWIHYLIAEKGTNIEIVLHGLSMGASTVLMVSGEELPDNVKGIIADSPYTSVYDLFAYQMKRMYHLPSVPILPTLSVVTNIRAGYTLQEANALQQVKKATVPILYIHGNEDTFVPFSMSETLYENTKSKAELVIFPEANHGESVVIHKKEYYDELNQFLHDIY